MKKLNTKKSYFMSLISLLLCISMFISTTFAWFTDSVASGSNRIIAGNLDVEMYWAESIDGPWYDVEDPDHDILFGEDELWEPGYTSLRYIKIVNAGSLAFKYKLSVEAAGEVGTLAEVIDVKYIPEGMTEGLSERSDFEVLPTVGNLTTVLAGYTANSDLAPTGKILPAGENSNGDAFVGETVCAIALHMQEEAGNEYQGTDIGEGFYISVTATQIGYESDAFDSDYDTDASFPALNLEKSISKPVELDAQNAVKTETVLQGEGDISAVVPAGTKLESGTGSAVLTVTKVKSEGNISASDTVISQTLDVHLEGVASDNDKPILVTVKRALPTDMNTGAITLYHKEGDEQKKMTSKASAAEVTAHNDYYYDSTTGNVTMALAHFSEILFKADTANVWDGSVAKKFASGDGTRANPYVIKTVDQLAYFSETVNAGTDYAGKYVKLGANLAINTWDIPEDADSDYKGLHSAKSLGEENSPAFEQNGKLYKYFTPIGHGSNLPGETGEADLTPFRGTFDGDGYTVSGLFNLWYGQGGANGYGVEYGDAEWTQQIGLFGCVEDATIKNLTVADSFIYTYGGMAGLVASYATGTSTFDNVNIKNNYATAYNNYLGGIVGCAFDYGTVSAKLTFSNVTVDNTNKLEALWGTYDAPVGGVVGASYPKSDITFTGCTVYPEMNLYNDCCANYQWFAYRYSGMLIGYVRTGERATYLANKVHCNGVTVKYGEWTDQYYCELRTLGKGSYNGAHEWKYAKIAKNEVSRAEDGTVTGCTVHDHAANNNGVEYSYRGQTYTSCAEDEDNTAVNLNFHQLFGGGQGVYGEETHSGVTVLDNCGSIKAKLPNTDSYLYRVGNLNEVQLGSLFEAEAGTGISSGAVNVTAESMIGVTSVDFVKNPDDWTLGELKFSGSGVIRLTVNYLGTTTTLNLEVLDAFNATTAVSATSYDVVLLNDVENAEKLYVSNGHTFYGNGFKLKYTGNGGEAGTTQTHFSYGFVEVTDGTLENVQVICPLFREAYGFVLGDVASYTEGGYYPYMMSAVVVNNATISDCYIYGARTNIYSRFGNATIENTVLEKGATANMQLWSSAGCEFTLKDVTTIQYVDKNGVYGFGILNGHNETDSNATINIQGYLKQYNWICADDANGVTNEYIKAGINSAVEETAYQHTYGGKTYINTGIVNLNVGTATVNDSGRTDGLECGQNRITISRSGASYNGQVYSVLSESGNVELSAPAYKATTNGFTKPGMIFALKETSDKIKMDGEDVRITLMDNDSTEFNLAEMFTAKKYVSIDRKNITCVYGSANTNINVTDGKVNFDLAGRYVVTYTVTDSNVYDKDGKLTGESKTYTKSVVFLVSVINSNIKDAEFEFDKSQQHFYYKTINTLKKEYKQFIPILNGLKIYDYKADGTQYKAYDFDNENANAAASIVRIEHENDNQISTTTFYLINGGTLTINYNAYANGAHGSTYTTTIQKDSNGKIYAVNDGITAATAEATSWDVHYYEYTGNNGKTVRYTVKSSVSSLLTSTDAYKNGKIDTSTAKDVSGGRTNYYVNGDWGRDSITLLDYSTMLPQDVLFTGEGALTLYKQATSTDASGFYIYNYGYQATGKSVTFSSYTSVSSKITYKGNATDAVLSEKSALLKTNSQTTVTGTVARSGFTFGGWYTQAQGGEKFGEQTIDGNNFTLTATLSSDVTLYAHWLKDVTVSYNTAGGPAVSPTNSQSSLKITLPEPGTYGTATFTGWYDSEKSVADGGNYIGEPGDDYYIPEADTTLYAHWIGVAVNYTVTYNYNDGATANGSATYKGEALQLPDAPTYGGAGGAKAKTFAGWYDAQTGGNKLGDGGAAYTPTGDTTVYAHWDDKTYKISFEIGNSNGNNTGAKVSQSSLTVKYGAEVTYTTKHQITVKDGTTTTTVTYSNSSGYGVNGWTISVDGTALVSGGNWPRSDAIIITGNSRFYGKTGSGGGGAMYSSGSGGSSGGGSCVTPDTLITMADGTQKPVEEVKAGDLVLVWNLKTGAYDVAPVVFNDAEAAADFDVIYARFSDGTEVGIVSEHGFFDVDLGKYVYFDENAAQYIGHRFIKYAEDGWDTVTLTEVEMKREHIAVYSPTTYEHLCVYANGMLSMPGGIAGIFNIYDVDTETMRYDAEAMARDIETYGLFTPEDFRGVVTEEMFYCWNGADLKVAIGKGILTWETVEAYAYRYGPIAQEQNS